MKVYVLGERQFDIEEGDYLLETDKDLGMMDVITYDGKYYAVCTRKLDGSACGVRKLKRFEPEPEAQEYEHYFVCPYCGHIDYDSFELEDNGTTECGLCGGEVEFERVVTVEYNVYPKKAPELIDLERED